MPFRKPDAATAIKTLADESFEADFLQDCFDGVLDFLDTNNVPEGNDDPETIIVIRNNIPSPSGVRTFSGAIYVGKPIAQIVNDIK